MNLRPAQQKAVEARGNVVVVAGAGTGKTRTLVERCLHCLSTGEPRTGIDQMLLVTFTEAAAAEMRERIRCSIEQNVSASPDDEHWQSQLALFESAHIGTLHGFCYKLVRQHFYSLGLDPQLAVMSEAEKAFMAQEVLTEILNAHYSGNSLLDQQVRDLAELQGGARGESVLRAAVLRFHTYAQTLANPGNWLQSQLKIFCLEAHPRWHEWYEAAVRQWRTESIPYLGYLDQSDGNELARACKSILETACPETGSSWIADCLARVQTRLGECPYGKKGLWLDPLKAFAGDASFLASLLPVDGTDPLQQDWHWVREPVATCIRLALEFAERFAAAKRQAGLLDFHDLEQFALDLLWDRAQDRPTTLAESWRQRLRFLFVDEYQDINEAQDKILVALSREEDQANRFLVGDVKQSIYRFRLASPKIFQQYVRTWRDTAGCAVALQENFRSRENILQFVNSLFETVMVPELGGVAYDSDAQLQFGSAPGRERLSRVPGACPRVEIRLRLKGLETPEESGAGTDLHDMDEASKDARAVALHLSQLHREAHAIWDETLKQERPVRWADMAILLRARKSRTAVYAREFSRLGIPLHVDRGGFYENSEVLDLLSLLELLDNPFQDIPVLAVLRSPFVGLSANELTAIRMGRARCSFWAALRQWFATKRDPADVWTTQETRSRVGRFLGRYGDWRRMVRRASLSSFLASFLAETGYDTWLLAQDDGTRRYANVQRLIGMAKEFDRFQRQGLVRFLNFLKAQRDLESEPEVPARVSEDAVRLLTIHQSKGLEFPVVVLAGITSPFNFKDLSEDLLFDEEYGVCCAVKPPHNGSRYPSLPLWLARRRQNRELRGEELRLFYVALTRARDTLILSGSLTEKQLGAWQQALPDSSALGRAKSAAEWLGIWAGRHGHVDSLQRKGSNELVSWHILNELDLLCGTQPEPCIGADTLQAGNMDWDRLTGVLGWRYLFATACLQPAKSTVSAIRRAAAALDEESHVWPLVAATHRNAPGSSATAAESGTLHHLFLQHVNLDLCSSAQDLRGEAERMVRLGILTAAHATALDLDSIADFWNSDLGQQIRSSTGTVRRELPFTVRLAASEVRELIGSPGQESEPDEFMIVQGVIDLLFKGPDGLVIVDFKTDSVSLDQLGERAAAYRPQLAVYARAVQAVYGEPPAECWLYFLKPGKALQVNPSELLPG